MAKKKSRPKQSAEQIFNVTGGIHAGHTVVMGSQTNVQTANIQSPQEFAAALQRIQAQVSALKQQPQLTSAQARNIAVVEAKVSQAVDETRQPQPLGERVRAALTEAKDTLDLLAGGLQSAVGLGTAVGGLAVLAVKIFGG